VPWGAAAIGAAAVACSVLFTRASVSGDSMRPALEPGDRLLVRRAGRVRLRPGDLVTVPDPRADAGGRILVKRVVAVEAGSVTLGGDNPASSTDSRSFGPVPASSVIGRVVYRYGPPGRSGRPGAGTVSSIPLGQ